MTKEKRPKSGNTSKVEKPKPQPKPPTRDQIIASDVKAIFKEAQRTPARDNKRPGLPHYDSKKYYSNGK
jgi:hypothetical protein